MVDYGLAFKRPFMDMKTLSIGAGLYLLVTVLLLVPFIGWLAAMALGLVLNGYMLLCAKTIMDKKKDLPEFKNYGGLFVQGLIFTVITLIYLIPALVIGIVVGGVAFMTGVTTGGSLLSIFGGLGLSLMLFVLVILLTFYVLPVAIMNYAKTGKFNSAFQFAHVFRKAFTGTYFVPWFIAGVYIFALMAVAGMIELLLAITIVLPFVIGAVASFMLGVTVYSLLAQAVNETKG